MWVISSLAIQLLFFDNQVNFILVAKSGSQLQKFSCTFP